MLEVERNIKNRDRPVAENSIWLSGEFAEN